MRSLAYNFVLVILVSSKLYAQDPAPAAGTQPPAPVPPLVNTGAPMLVPFHCSEPDMENSGLSCSQEEPCPVYLELAAIASSGIRIFAAGNIHTATATLYSVVLGTEDNGQTWREVHERIPGSGLDHLQFSGAEMGWSSGVSLAPLPQDPFLLTTTDGGQTWRVRPIFNEPRFGSIQQFYFEDKRAGELAIDHGPGSATDRYELYETNDGGETWNIRESNLKPIRLKRAPLAPNPDWRVRADAASKSFHVEHRLAGKWTSIAAFQVNLGVCKPE
jgi:hypothetical protein